MFPSREELERMAQQLVYSSKRPNTRRTYSSAQRQFIAFCKNYQLTALPCEKDTVLLFVAYMHANNFKLSSVKVYLSAIRSLHLEEGFPSPTEDFVRLDLALRALAIKNGAPSQKLPITYQLLSRVAPFVGHTYDSKLLWAAMTLGHFGLLRAAEFTIPAQGKFVPAKHLTLSDVAFGELPDGATYLSVRIKSSKTDRYNQGTTLYIGCTQTKVCAYCAMQQFVLERKSKCSHEGPLFLLDSGAVLTRHIMVKNTQLYLTLAGVDASKYSTHSYRAGGATTMAAAGMSDWEIQISGRWSSNAYQRYIRPPISLLVTFAKRMVLDTNTVSSYHMRNPYIKNIFGEV